MIDPKLPETPGGRHEKIAALEFFDASIRSRKCDSEVAKYMPSPNTFAENLDFTEVARLVAESLTATGYTIARRESQEWAVNFSLNSPNIDGSTEVFFGPAVRISQGGFDLPYLIVREETRRGEVHLPTGSGPESAASALLNRLHETLVDLLQTVHRHDTHVGRGLLPVSDAPGGR